MNSDQDYAYIDNDDLKDLDYAPETFDTPMIFSPGELCTECKYLEDLGHKGSNHIRGLCTLGWPGVFSEEIITCDNFLDGDDAIEIRRCRIKIDLPGQKWKNRTVVITRSGNLLAVLPETPGTRVIPFEG